MTRHRPPPMSEADLQARLAQIIHATHEAKAQRQKQLWPELEILPWR